MSNSPGITDSDEDRQSESRAIRSVGLQFWVNGMVFASFIPRLPEIRDRIGVELGGLGLLLTLGSVGGLLGSGLCGPLIERFGTKRVMLSGALGLVAVLPLVGLADRPWLFLTALLAMQLFDVLTDVAMNMQGSWLSGRRSVPVMSRLHGLWSVGTVVGGVLATVAASRVSLQIHLFVVALVLLATLLYVGPGLLTVDQRSETSDEDTAIGDRPKGSWRVAALFAMLAMMAVVIEMGPTDWAAIRLVEDFGQSPGRAGIGFVAMTSGMVIGRFSGDAATARLGRANLNRTAASISALGLGLATLVPDKNVALVGFVLAGLGASVIFPGLYDLAARAPGRPGAVLGAMTAGIRIGLIGLPVAIGMLASSGLSVGAALAITTLPAAVGLIFLGLRAG